MSVKQITLGTVALSPFGRTETGGQPMPNAQADRWIIYDGRLTNRMALWQQLCQCGHSIPSETDAAVVLAAFQEWGTRCAERLLGMFAFVIYDRPTETVTLVRDRLGMKPLYYTSTHGQLSFASDMKPLMATLSSLQLNKVALRE
jgi:asparagine synthase (glutamine-hydrolysing)